MVNKSSWKLRCINISHEMHQHLACNPSQKVVTYHSEFGGRRGISFLRERLHLSLKKHGVWYRARIFYKFSAWLDLRSWMCHFVGQLYDCSPCRLKRHSVLFFLRWIWRFRHVINGCGSHINGDYPEAIPNRTLKAHLPVMFDGSFWSCVFFQNKISNKLERPTTTNILRQEDCGH